ncbi:MAG: hypothetical protein GY947_07305 [Rhodobacteraceae bacterium]|nr:hypothetical protein [Paracoccaceae bacterium]
MRHLEKNPAQRSRVYEKAVEGEDTGAVEPPLVLETAEDRDHALRQISGRGGRWLDRDQLSNLFVQMQDGFDGEAVLPIGSKDHA